jgi:chromosome segregation ATPase
MEDENLSGLDLAAAKEYIFAFTVDAKRLDQDIAAAQGELERWKGRLGLAEAKLAAGDQSISALAQAARAKVEEESGKIASLEAERSELRAKVARMREQLPSIKSHERSIDPDRLLAELQMMTGELLGDESGGRSAAATEADFARLETVAKADSDLAALKRRAAEGDKP